MGKDKNRIEESSVLGRKNYYQQSIEPKPSATAINPQPSAYNRICCITYIKRYFKTI
jgi:hypothetical protein